ncbi:hypothetical protein BKA70DRAFT_1234962 [Coprinopsis sp. MPI-PUGE-AT-0042]|nr:hypothetical protein BKA70DRAFT_1234962 [Coprinopsis sp. MPI-PUGE-AT-0042]
MTPVEMVTAIWSYVTSLWLLICQKPSRAFAFKYYKASSAPINTEEHADGRLEFELTDFTPDVPRWLEMSTLKGVGRLVYRAGSRETTSFFESHTPTTNDNPEIPIASPYPHSDVHEHSVPNQGLHHSSPRRSHPARHNVASPSPSSRQSGDSCKKGLKSG